MKCICNHSLPNAEIQLSNLNRSLECIPPIYVFIIEKSAFKLIKKASIHTSQIC